MTNKWNLLVGAVVLLAVLASVVALAVNKDITGTEALGVIGTIVTLGGGMLAVTIGSKTATAAHVEAINAARGLSGPPEG